MKNFYLLILLFATATCTLAQNTLIAPLQKIEQKRLSDSARKAEAEAYAKAHNIPVTMQSTDGSYAELMGFNEDGTPLYYITDNTDAGRTVSTDKVHPGGSLGLNLSGENMEIGEWDGGKVRLTHAELSGRVTQVDAPPSLSDHATHVAGTLIGTGVSANAKGMAYKASLLAYNWTSDESEMALAAANGLILSNHSYGNITGWFKNDTENRWEWYGDPSISETEDWKYGFYSTQARDWDEIVNDNPYYLPVKSAGNDRGEQPPASVSTHYVWDFGNFTPSSTSRPATGPHDCIVGAGVAKNVLTVGAVEAIPTGYSQASDVVMSSFSGWGPTDDGRIKPDICGNGVGVYSSISTGNTSYASYNGTSMAAPNVAGSLLLVQEHYKNLNNVFMRSSTLKGLVIHTADEAGIAEGPDYTFGWGLLNTAKCVATISNTSSNRIIEENLLNLTTYEIAVYSDGTVPLWTTLSWNDPKAGVSSSSLDPTTIKLINDLDVRVIRLSDNQSFMPYILNPANPANAATTGDNIRDNVEKIYLAAPQAGFYKIKVSHKGTLSALSQYFSLIVSGESPAIQSDFSADVTQVCEGFKVTYTPIILGVPTDYEWTFPGGTPASSLDTSPSVIYPTGGTYDVSLKASNPAATDTEVKANYITVHNTPLVNITPFDSAFCANNENEFVINSTPPATYMGPGIVNNKLKPSNAGPGSHWIIAAYTDINGCTGYDSTELYIKTPPAKPSITHLKDTLISSVTGIIQWYSSGIQPLAGQQSTFLLPNAEGEYYIGVKDSTGCESLSDPFAYFPSSMKEHKLSGNFFPNPASNELNIVLNRAIKNMSLKLISADGRLVLEKEYSDGNSFNLDINHLTEGVYYLRLSSGTEEFGKSVVISR